MITFGSTPQRSGNWAWFKPLIVSKTIKLQYEETAGEYLIFGYDPPEAVSCTIWKGIVPDGVIAGGYSQGQNDADKGDFESNYKNYANRSIDDIPSYIIATTLSKAGGGSNLNVDGSVTPVVFDYTPPNGWDIEVTALNFLFESGTALSFGNKFITTGISPLSNGLLLETKAGDVEISPWQTMKRTRDLVEICEDFEIVTGTTNFIRVKVHLPRSLRLFRNGTFAQPDYLRVTVRDNLSSLSFGEAHFQGVKV